MRKSCIFQPWVILCLSYVPRSFRSNTNKLLVAGFYQREQRFVLNVPFETFFCKEKTNTATNRCWSLFFFSIIHPRCYSSRTFPWWCGTVLQGERSKEATLSTVFVIHGPEESNFPHDAVRLLLPSPRVFTPQGALHSCIGRAPPSEAQHRWTVHFAAQFSGVTE